MESADAARVCSVESFVITYYLLSFSVECLHAIVVTDRDGVPVIKGEDLSLLNPSVLTMFIYAIFSVTECLGTFPPKSPKGLHRVSQYAFDYKERLILKIWSGWSDYCGHIHRTM